MNRHHPYNFDQSGPRRGGSPQGPDRHPNRFQDRGGPGRYRGRGRGGGGGYSSYDNGDMNYGASFNHGPPTGPTRGNMSNGPPYNGYDSVPDPYYQAPYDPPVASHFSASVPSSAYGYEEDNGPNYDAYDRHGGHRGSPAGGGGYGGGYGGPPNDSHGGGHASGGRGGGHGPSGGYGGRPGGNRDPPPSLGTAGYGGGPMGHSGMGGPGDNQNGAGGPGRRPLRRNDDKSRESIIEERIQRERPGRILFIRNIKYETNSADVRRQFEEFGDIKTFFDLISTRGMVFITYFDLRAAERARERMQGTELSGRPIDVHFSLPRTNNDRPDDDKNNQLQGTLEVTLRNSASGLAIDEEEVRHKFQQLGDVKSIRPVGDSINSRYVEYFDTRACTEAYERLRGGPLQDGTMDIVFSWDNSEAANKRESTGGRDWDDVARGGRGAGRSNGRNQRRGGGRGGYDDSRARPFDDDRRGNHHSPGPGGPARHYDYPRRFDDDSHGNRGPPGYDQFQNNHHGGYGPSREGYGGPEGRDGGDRGGRGAYSIAPPLDPPSSYLPGPSGPSTYPVPGPSPSAGGGPLDQAQKVQQLLAALQQPEAGGGRSSDTVPGQFSAPPASRMSQPPYPTGSPSGNGYGAAPTATPPVDAAWAGLPPNILALLQAAQQQSQSGGTYGTPAQDGDSYKQLLNYLQPKSS